MITCGCRLKERKKERKKKKEFFGNVIIPDKILYKKFKSITKY